MAATVVSSTMIARARALRKKITLGEARLWSELREFRKRYGLHVRKQVPIGSYVVDFAIQSRKLIVEVDGEHHFEAAQMARDEKRDAWFRQAGYRVLRFSTGDLADSFEGCIDAILRELDLL